MNFGFSSKKNRREKRKGCLLFTYREEWILRDPRSSSFWFPRNLSYHMIRQARIGDTVLVKSREMTGRTQTFPWWLGGEVVKTTENKIHPRCNVTTSTVANIRTPTQFTPITMFHALLCWHIMQQWKKMGSFMEVSLLCFPMGSQRVVVYILIWPIAPSYVSLNAWGGG